MAEAARVIRMVGKGEQQLRDAIQSGMLSIDAERAFKQVLEDNKRLRKENRELKERLAVVRESRAEERRCKVEAYRMVLSKETDYQRAKDWRVAACVALVAVGALSMMFGTLISIF